MDCGLELGWGPVKTGNWNCCTGYGCQARAEKPKDGTIGSSISKWVGERKNVSPRDKI